MSKVGPRERIIEYYTQCREQLIKNYSRRCGSPENAEDLIQEAFTRALEYAESLDDRPIEPWIARILSNALKDAQRDYRMQGATTDSDDLIEVLESNDLDLNDRRIVDEVHARIKAIGGEDGEILRLYYVCGYNPRDVSRIMDVDNQRVRYVALQFKKELQKEYL